MKSTPRSPTERFERVLAELRQADWSNVSYVLGTREDLSFSGISHPCCVCGEPVYTGRVSQCYPEGVSYICEVCYAHLPEETD